MRTRWLLLAAGSLTVTGLACGGDDTSTPDAQAADAQVADATVDSPTPPPPDATVDQANPKDAGSDADADAGCGDTQTSSTNCGTCGHDCLGGACSGGACLPVTIASGLGAGVTAIAADGTNVYFNVSGVGIDKCKATGCGGTPTLLVANAGAVLPVGMVTDGTRVYWSQYADDGGVFGCDVGGCDAGARFGTTGYAYPGSLGLQGAKLAWATGDCLIYTCDAKAGCSSATQIATLCGVASNMQGDSTSLYWASATAAHACDTANCNTTYRDLNDGGITTGFVAHVSLAGTELFVTNRDALPDASVGSVVALDVTKTGQTPAVIAKGQLLAESVLADATNVYWYNACTGSGTCVAGDGALLSCPKSGCVGPPKVLIAKLHSSKDGTAMAQDTVSVFVNDYDAVLRIAKP